MTPTRFHYQPHRIHSRRAISLRGAGHRPHRCNSRLTLSTATAGSSDGSVAKVEFYQGATLIGTAAAPPYSVIWSNVANGSYSQGFSWASVAASAIAAPLTQGILGKSGLNITNPVAQAAVGSLVSATTRVAIVGGKLNWQAVAADTLTALTLQGLSGGNGSAATQPNTALAQQDAQAKLGVTDDSWMSGHGSIDFGRGVQVADSGLTTTDGLSPTEQAMLAIQGQGQGTSDWSTVGDINFQDSLSFEAPALDNAQAESLNALKVNAAAAQGLSLAPTNENAASLGLYDTPVWNNHDLSSPTGFAQYLNDIQARSAAGGRLNPEDISTSKALLFNYYGFPMGEQTGNMADLAGNLGGTPSAAFARALDSFAGGTPEYNQKRYDFYSNIHSVFDASGNPTRGRYVDVTQGDRTIRVNWDKGFSDWARDVGVGADEALRKTDFDVYQKTIHAAFATDGVTSFNIYGAWRPSKENYLSIHGSLPPGYPNGWSPAHVTSRAIDINMINDVPINNANRYANGRPTTLEPNLIQRFTDNLADQPGANQIFQPWRMDSHVNTNEYYPSEPNTNAKGNNHLHNNHLHFGTL